MVDFSIRFYVEFSQKNKLVLFFTDRRRSRSKEKFLELMHWAQVSMLNDGGHENMTLLNNIHHSTAFGGSDEELHPITVAHPLFIIFTKLFTFTQQKMVREHKYPLSANSFPLNMNSTRGCNDQEGCTSRAMLYHGRLGWPLGLPQMWATLRRIHVLCSGLCRILHFV